MPASSGAVREAQGFRRLVLASGAGSDVVLTVPDFRSGNRFSAVADRDGEANIPGLHGTACRTGATGQRRHSQRS